MKPVRNMLTWLGLITLVIVSFGFVSNKQSRIICHDIIVTVKDSVKTGFVERRDILKLIREDNHQILGSTLKEINTELIEKRVSSHPVVKKCEVYKTVDGELHIDINQRHPVVRVLNDGMQTYYIDRDGYVVPFTEKYTSYVLFVNGNIKENKPINFEKSEPVSLYDVNGKRNILSDIYTIAHFIYTNAFWRSQIMQIYVNEKGEFELVPRVGAHIIYFGDAEKYEFKFRKLKALYTKGFNNIGWNNHTEINLKYKNQVICTKR